MTSLLHARSRYGPFGHRDAKPYMREYFRVHKVHTHLFAGSYKISNWFENQGKAPPLEDQAQCNKRYDQKLHRRKLRKYMLMLHVAGA